MEREEAISWLTNEKWTNANNKYKKEWNEAFDLAIEALKADSVSRKVYDKRTQADEEIIDSYRQEFQKALSAEAVPTMTEKVREALMRLTMCAREECGMCKYKNECGFDFQYNISTENMHTILDALSADAVQGEWKHTITGQPYCSNCEYVFGEDEEFSPFWKYCPMCGARMRGGAE